MKKSILLLMICMFFSINLYSQIITGYVTDSNNEVVPYATVQIGENYGVITNTEGIYSIDTSSFEKTNPVKISFIGYKTLVLDVGTLSKQKDFILKQDLVSLDQIFLTNKKYTPEELLDQVITHRDANYSKEDSKSNVFLRSSYTNQPQRSEFEFKKSTLFSKSTLKEVNKKIEARETDLKGLTSTNYEESLLNFYRSGGSTNTENLKSTILINKSEDLSDSALSETYTDVIKSHLKNDRTYKVKTGLLTIEDSLKIDIKNDKDDTHRKSADLNSNLSNIIGLADINSDRLDFIYETKKYNYTLENAAVFDGQTVYILGFNPKRRSARYEGNLYINAQDFSILKMEYKIADDRDGDKLNLKFIFGIKSVQQDANYLITFKKHIDTNKYIPSLIKNKVTTYSYLNRALKFTQNKIDEDEETKMLKIDILSENISVVENELYFLDYKKLASAESSYLQPEKYEIEYLKAYDPKLWEPYNIIQPVNELKEYVTE